MLIVFGEPGPEGVNEWIDPAFFPFAFSLAYLLGMKRPIIGGALSLFWVTASLIVIGRTFSLSAYVYWSILSIPGILYLWAGRRLRIESTCQSQTHDHEPRGRVAG